MKPGRNEPCPCGSGRKYKHCHGPGAVGPGHTPAPAAEAEAEGVELLRQGRAAEAERVFTAMLARSPDHVAALGHLGLARLLQGRAAEATLPLRRAAALEPSRAGAWANLGAALKAQDAFDEAEAALRRAVQIDDTLAVAHGNLGTLLMRRHDPSAGAAFERALSLDPAFADAHFNHASLLREQGRARESIAALRRAITLNPAHLPSWNNLMLGLLYADDVPASEVFTWHRRYDTLLGKLGIRAASGRTLAAAPAGGPDRPRPGPLRVGLLSPDLRRHSVASFLLPLLQHHDRARLAFHAYHDSHVHDATSSALQSRVAQWHDVAALDDETLARRIADDGIHVLVDLAGHTGLRLPLFARRAAPLQLSWLGYPASTGLAAMDGRLTDEACDPASHEALHSERVMRLPHGSFCYAPPPEAPPVAGLPMALRGAPTFGSFNAVPKLSPATLALWARVLNAVPASRLLLKAAGLADPVAAARIHDGLAGHGIGRHRVELRAWEADAADHLQTYAEVDVALDTTPYNGATTTCEALWMGVPVVTLRGDRSQARMGASILGAAGHPEWVAADPDAFAAVAAGLVADPGGLAAVRANLRQGLRASPLLDGPGFAAAWEAAVRRGFDGVSSNPSPSA